MGNLRIVWLIRDLSTGEWAPIATMSLFYRHVGILWAVQPPACIRRH